MFYTSVAMVITFKGLLLLTGRDVPRIETRTPITTDKIVEVMAKTPKFRITKYSNSLATIPCIGRVQGRLAYIPCSGQSSQKPYPIQRHVPA